MRSRKFQKSRQNFLTWDVEIVGELPGQTWWKMVRHLVHVKHARNIFPRFQPVMQPFRLDPFVNFRLNPVERIPEKGIETVLFVLRTAVEIRILLLRTP